MLHLPSRFAAVILSFAPLFFQRSWQHAEVLLIGAILAPGKRTVTRRCGDLGDLHEAREAHAHGDHHLAALQLLLGRVAQEVGGSDGAVAGGVCADALGTSGPRTATPTASKVALPAIQAHESRGCRCGHRRPALQRATSRR